MAGFATMGFECVSGVGHDLAHDRVLEAPVLILMTRDTDLASDIIPFTGRCSGLGILRRGGGLGSFLSLTGVSGMNRLYTRDEQERDNDK
jgi:hypothetical protein